MRHSKTQAKSLIETFNSTVDSIIGVFSPEAAFRRKYARAASTMLSGYSSASNDRLKNSWIPGGGSADADILFDLPTLRERSRDIVRNDGYASGIQKAYSSNIVGSGMKPQSRLKYERLGISKEEAVKFQDEFERIFELWAEEADAQNRLDFYEIQEMVIKQIFENGDIILLPFRRERKGKLFSLCFQLIEADRLCNPNFKPNGKLLREGVELGELGEPIRYWIKKTHPGDSIFGGISADDFVVYNALDEYGNKNVFHLFRSDRPGQSRGVPVLAPVLSLFKDLSSYVEAELLKNRIAACFALFIKKTDPMAAAIGKSNTTSNNQRLEYIEPGRIDYLNPGESIETSTPNNPGGGFEPFVVSILRSIAASLNLPYEIVSRDFSRTNYSSARAAMLDAIKYFKGIQNWQCKKLNQPVYEMVIEEAYLKGEIDIPNFYKFKKEWCRTKWQLPGWQWIDPLKEVNAASEALKNKFKSRADICGDLGNDWEETLEQIATEESKAKDLGISTETTGNNIKNTPPGIIDPKGGSNHDDQGDINNE